MGQTSGKGRKRTRPANTLGNGKSWQNTYSLKERLTLPKGMKPLPPGQYSFDKDEAYTHELNEEYQVLVNNENIEQHSAPIWVNDMQREITHSGESPLFTNKLLPSTKFEQEHGCVTFERALLGTRNKRLPSPKRRHLNGARQYYRPNSTHQYLSATDLRNMHEKEENMIKYGRPTRTTLLRARQRSNSAPINAYDIRRENTKRIEEVKNNTVFCTSKDSFEREQTRISYSSLEKDQTRTSSSCRMYNLYASDGETMHSFLTGARYNRAHLLDSRGLTEYGLYMPRENPTDCFIASNRRGKEAGDDIPSAPPDSPRSDLGDVHSPALTVTRPMSGVVHYRPTSSVRPGSSKTGSGSKTTSSRPQSHRVTSSKTPGSRPRSGKDSVASSVTLGTRSLPPRPSEGSRREPLPEEITMAMPDHINKTGRGGVYVTLKGQKMLESVESKLPRVTGVSLPKIRKSRDHVEEMAMVNQPPPTPIDVSMVGADKSKTLKGDYDECLANDQEYKQPVNNTEEHLDNLNNVNNGNEVPKEATNTQNDNSNEENDDTIDLNIGKVTISTNEITSGKTMEIGPVKHVNFSENEATIMETARESEATATPHEENNPEKDIADDGKKKSTENGENVVFFVTEDRDEGDIKENKETENKDSKESSDKSEVIMVNNDISKPIEIPVDSANDDSNGSDTGEKSVDEVIKVEISETEKVE